MKLRKTIEGEIRTKIHGVSHDDPINEVPRQAVIRKFLRPGRKLEARLEPDNAADPDAVAIRLPKRAFLFFHVDYHLGYLSRDLAKKVAPLLRDGADVEVTVLEVTGGSKDKPTRGVNVVLRYRHTSD